MNGSWGTGPADALRQFTYGEVPLDQWVGDGDGDAGEPWDSFEHARQLVRAGRQRQAVEIGRQIALTEGLETRQALQAWHFLRAAGDRPPADRTKLVLGAVAEIPVHGAHDLLAAYRDGTARYLNYAGQAVVWEDRSVTTIQSAIRDWLARAQVIANAVSPRDKPALPAASARTCAADDAHPERSSLRARSRGRPLSGSGCRSLPHRRGQPLAAGRQPRHSLTRRASDDQLLAGEPALLVQRGQGADQRD